MIQRGKLGLDLFVSRVGFKHPFVPITSGCGITHNQRDIAEVTKRDEVLGIVRLTSTPR